MPPRSQMIAEVMEAIAATGERAFDRGVDSAPQTGRADPGGRLSLRLCGAVAQSVRAADS